MITEISLQIEETAGVQLRVINTLKKHGLRAVSHALKDSPDDGKQLTLEVESDEPIDESSIAAITNSIAGVISTLKISSDTPDTAVEAEAEPEPEAAPELTEEESRFKNKDSEAGDADIRDRMLVFSLLSRYPNIANRLIELKGTLPAEDHPLRFYQLGRGFGQHLVANLKVKDAIHDLESALEKVVAPGLQPLAEFTRVNTVISVTGYSKNLDRGKPDELLCHFFRGTIEGLLRGAGMPDYQVEKNQCLHKGESCCEYHILPA
jgi:predicted hydrocarbon binding protein